MKTITILFFSLIMTISVFLSPQAEASLFSFPDKEIVGLWTFSGVACMPAINPDNTFKLLDYYTERDETFLFQSDGSVMIAFTDNKEEKKTGSYIIQNDQVLISTTKGDIPLKIMDDKLVFIGTHVYSFCDHNDFVAMFEKSNI